MKISALDESGKPVDWFFIYKVPQLTGTSDTDQTTGYEYVYYDSTIDEKTGQEHAISKSPYVLDSDKGAMNLTLDAVFKQPKDTTGWILYNDEKPGGVPGKDAGTLGHTKGVLAFDVETKTGFWLLHSWPKFAEPNPKMSPTPKYGQTYLCLSLSLDTLEKIAAQMYDHQQPQTYCPRIPKGLSDSSPLSILSKGVNSNAEGNASVLELQTIGKMDFQVIAKNREWNQDFWNGLVGPTLKDDMDVETWIRGAIPPVADTDGIHKTFDIKYINLGFMGIHVAWPETHDHAKWGITTHNNWVCVGDINRMISQRKRGGGTIAFQNPTLWHSLSKTDLILAPPNMTRTDAVNTIQKSHQDPHDHEGSHPPPKIHAMKNAPKPEAPTLRGKKVKPLVPEKNHPRTVIPSLLKKK
jgi:deoxyribonuclease II